MELNLRTEFRVGTSVSMDYEYRAEMHIVHGGYDGEWKGVNPEDTSWHNGAPGTEYGPLTYSYFYTDSNSADNNNSSRVTITATDKWTGEFDDENNLHITITTTINSIVRGEFHGNPLIGGNYTRDITVSRMPGQQPPNWYVNGNNIGIPATLSGTINVGTETLTIPPGEQTQRGSLYVLNHTTGFPWTEDFVDEMWAGINFRNPRDAKPPRPPLDYRPGATYDGSTWQSHNRNGGAANQNNGPRWAEMRTESGPDYENQPATGNPPSMSTPSGWRNMFNIGENRWPDPPGNPYVDPWV